MPNTENSKVRMFYVVLEKDPVVVMTLDYGVCETIVCITFSRVGGNQFIKQCLVDGILLSVDYESFDRVWEFYNFPHFHVEEETIIDGHSAEQLSLALDVYTQMVHNDYDPKGLFELFKVEKCPSYSTPIPNKGPSKVVEPKDAVAIMVSESKDEVTYYFDKSDAFSLVGLYDDKPYKKKTRKMVLHSALPFRSIEPVRTYKGLTGEAMAFLFWVDYAFGE